MNYQGYLRTATWRNKCKSAMKATGNRCVLLPFLKAKEVHHFSYKNLGNEKIWVDIVPLSKTAHRWVHLWGLCRGSKSGWVKIWGLILKLLFPFVSLFGRLLPIK